MAVYLDSWLYTASDHMIIWSNNLVYQIDGPD